MRSFRPPALNSEIAHKINAGGGPDVGADRVWAFDPEMFGAMTNLPNTSGAANRVDLQIREIDSDQQTQALVPG
jgi:hypothetical protein